MELEGAEPMQLGDSRHQLPPDGSEETPISSPRIANSGADPGSCSESGKSEDVADQRHCSLRVLSEIVCGIEFEEGDLPPGVTGDDVATVVNGMAQDDGSGATSEFLEEKERAVPLWVKWRGKWQSGIRCPKVDCPLSTLKAKPTDKIKKYISVFFPRTGTYFWVDPLLIRPIEEFPEPLISGNHNKWKMLVRDLTIPRRHIMQKLVIAMLNFSHELHVEALNEDARMAATWKEFASEASSCGGYVDIGKMLVKLQRMVLPAYLSNDWLHSSIDSWVKRCEDAQSAETIETLTEELVQSVLWKKVDALRNAPEQDPVPEWKLWKEDIMKCIIASHTIGNAGDALQNKWEIENDASCVDPGDSSKKRLKLEVRRAEGCTPQKNLFGDDIGQNDVGGDCNELGCEKKLETTQIVEPNEVDPFHKTFTTQLLQNSTEICEASTSYRNDLSIVQNPNHAIILTSGSTRAALHNLQNGSYLIKNGRHCSAYIEAKGRLCGRWANEGSTYCSVHLNMHLGMKQSSVERKSPIETAMCSGVTTQGTKCKHHAQHGSSFCKKHRFQNHHAIQPSSLDGSSHYFLKQENSEIRVANVLCSNAFNKESLTSQDPYQGNLVQVADGENLEENNGLMKASQFTDALPTSVQSSNLSWPRCIINGCHNSATRHTMYCGNHVPRFLKRARNGKSRLISKDVFSNLARTCTSRSQRVHLHQACEHLYIILKQHLSHKHTVFGSDSIERIFAEISKDSAIGEYFVLLVSSEREKLTRIWGFNSDKLKAISSLRTHNGPILPAQQKGARSFVGLACKICGGDFSNDQALGLHWTESHKKEARWLFRGYACGICMGPFTNKKVLESHVHEHHGVPPQNYMLFRCMSCNNLFSCPEQLWKHVLASHSLEFSISDLSQQSQTQAVELALAISDNVPSTNQVIENDDGSQKITCGFCGLKFDLLQDLGHHHQVAHMSSHPLGYSPARRGKYKLKTSGHLNFEQKRSLDPFQFRKHDDFGAQTKFKCSDSLVSLGTKTEVVCLGGLLDSDCLDVAQALFSKIRKIKPHPNNIEMLSTARCSCCRISFSRTLESKYGILPENTYLKVAKLCSEMDIQINWYKDGFSCPNGCNSVTPTLDLAPLNHVPEAFPERLASIEDAINDGNWDMDECHFVLNSSFFGWKAKRNLELLCEDISFGKENIPIACVIDDSFRDSILNDTEAPLDQVSLPWHDFTYVNEMLIEPSLGIDTKSVPLGCACSEHQCCPENCDHVYLFNDDYETAEAVDGSSMRGRFAYNERGQTILKEGYIIYECNSSCACAASCQNRVLQKGIQVKLELFRTERGWAVRAAEAIPQGTFVCEFIGELLQMDEAKRRYSSISWSCIYDLNIHIDQMKGLVEEGFQFVIDATQYGNIAHFITRNLSPNLVSFLVLVESLDFQLGHIGFYASRDIAVGEELSYSYTS